MNVTKEEIKKLGNLIKLYDDAIEIVQKYINKFKGDPEYDVTITDLRNGLDVLECGRKNKKDNFDWLSSVLKIPKEKRGGFGLSRGFGEFLWKADAWQREIMNAIHKIEDYYRNM